MVDLTAEEVIAIFKSDPEEGLDIGMTLAESILNISEEIGLENLDDMHKNYYLMSTLMVYMYDVYVDKRKQEVLH